ncbi:hypothetical protein [Pseudomonas sp. Irchel 3E13]|uniref:hypothetical protein n=1 Tax=Pseudomonas sp. Irchel 3E13 TaxID=2008975 RepID=UPI000BA462DF|nr:hypothetical protein [Pseudomonas sp. Irchel 3E13]
MNNQLTLTGHESMSPRIVAMDSSCNDSNLVQTDRTPLDLLKDAVEAGLTFADCLNHFGVESSSNPFARAAREIYAAKSDNNIEIDDKVIISRCEYGAFVDARLFVRDCEAGLPGIVDLIDLLLQHIFADQGKAFAGNNPRVHDMVRIVEDTFGNHGDVIEELSGHAADIIPKELFVLGGHVEEGSTSGLVKELVEFGAKSGFDLDFCEAINNWIDYKGKLLDASLGAANAV